MMEERKKLSDLKDKLQEEKQAILTERKTEREILKRVDEQLNKVKQTSGFICPKLEEAERKRATEEPKLVERVLRKLEGITMV